MPNLTIRNLSDEAHRALRVRAARHGRSTEAEIRTILEETVRPPKRMKIGTEIRRLAGKGGSGDEVDFPRRQNEIRGAEFQ